MYVPAVDASSGSARVVHPMLGYDTTANLRHASARRLAAMAGLAFLVVAPRTFDMGADPADYSIYGTSWQDEGFWNYPAAWAAVAGRWPDFPPPMHQVVPLYSLVQRCVFAAMGPGLLAARNLSIVGGIFTCLAIWVAFRPLGPRWQGCATLVYGTSFWCVAVDRLAAPEAISICFLAWATLVLAEPAWSRQRNAKP